MPERALFDELPMRTTDRTNTVSLLCHNGLTGLVQSAVGLGPSNQAVGMQRGREVRILLVVEDLDRFELTPLEHSQARPAARADVSNCLGESQLLDGRRAITTADNACG